MSARPLIVSPPVVPQAGTILRPTAHGLSKFQIRERVAWLFVEGFRGDTSPLEFSQTSRSEYLAAPLRGKALPDHYSNTISHRLIGVQEEGRVIPIALQYWRNSQYLRTDSNVHRLDVILSDFGAYISRGHQYVKLWDLDDVSCETEERIVHAIRNFLDIKRLHYPTVFYPTCGDHKRRVVVWPPTYHPDNPYAPPLIRCALERIQAKMRTNRNLRILDIGSGSGVVAVEIARQTGLRVDCIDVDPLVVANTRASALFAGLNHLIRAWKSDALEDVPEEYDFIISNCPRAVDSDSEDVQRFDSRGRMLQSILKKLPYNLRKGGEFLFMNREDIAKYISRYPWLRSAIIHQFSHEGYSFAVHRIVGRRD